jgi:hypothetical protein
MPPPTITIGTRTTESGDPIDPRPRIAWPRPTSSLTNSPASGRSPLIDKPTSAAAEARQNSRRVAISG